MCETVRENQPGACPICRMELVQMTEAAPLVESKPLMPGLPGGLQLEMKRLRPDEETLRFWQELAARGNDGPVIAV